MRVTQLGSLALLAVVANAARQNDDTKGLDAAFASLDKDNKALQKDNKPAKSAAPTKSSCFKMPSEQTMKQIFKSFDHDKKGKGMKVLKKALSGQGFSTQQLRSLNRVAEAKSKGGAWNKSEGAVLLKAIVRKINSWNKNCKIGNDNSEGVANSLIDQLSRGSKASASAI
jgi:hypothetical protein